MQFRLPLYYFFFQLSVFFKKCEEIFQSIQGKFDKERRKGSNSLCNYYVEGYVYTFIMSIETLMALRVYYFSAYFIFYLSNTEFSKLIMCGWGSYHGVKRIARSEEGTEDIPIPMAHFDICLFFEKVSVLSRCVQHPAYFHNLWRKIALTRNEQPWLQCIWFSYGN